MDKRNVFLKYAALLAAAVTLCGSFSACGSVDETKDLTVPESVEEQNVSDSSSDDGGNEETADVSSKADESAAVSTTTTTTTTVTTTAASKKTTTAKATQSKKKTTTSKAATTTKAAAATSATTTKKAVTAIKVTPASGTYYTNCAANLRSGNGTGYSVIATLALNTEITVTGKCENGWYAVKAGGYSGYMSGSVMSSAKTVVTTAAKKKPTVTTTKQNPVSSQEKESGKVMYTGDYLTRVLDKTGQIFQNWRIPAGSKVILYSVEVVPYTDPGGQSGGAVEVAKISYNGKICYVDYTALIESKEEELSPLWKLSEEARNKNISQAEKDKIAKSIAKEIAKEVISEAGSEHSAQQLIVATQKTRDRIYEPYGIIATEDDPQDWTAYSLFVAHRGSCAGQTRALGLVLDELGYEWEHINEDQWTHQFCKVKVKWKSKDRSKSGNYLYADTNTNIVTSDRSILEGDAIINFSEEFL